jgi:hypothetical protein
MPAVGQEAENQKAKGKNEVPAMIAGWTERSVFTFAFCLLPFAF